MYKYLIFLFFIYVFASCNQKNVMPQPTDDTVVRKDMEETENKSKRKEWLKLIHGGENSNWEQIEYENTLALLKYKENLSNPNRDGEELLAGGNILGKWIERGSNNQAGNVMNVAYDQENDWIYAIGGGGPMFRGGISGFNWELVNDDLKFDVNIMEVIKLPNGNTRLISGINRIPHYSDDEGKTWTKSLGFPDAQGGSQISTAFILKNKIYVLHRKSSGAKYIFYSSENGEKFEVNQVMTTSEERKIAICVNTSKDSIYAMESMNSERARLSSFNFSTNKFNIVNDTCLISFGDKKCNVQAVNINSENKFFSFNKDLKLLESKDFGKNWDTKSTLFASPWDVGLYAVPSKPANMFYGEVNAFRSQSGGIGWQKVNDWAEYYGNVKGKLHADIMIFKEVKDQDNKDVVLIGHHGGLSKTYNYGVSTENISLFGLNVSQYYDAASYPQDPSYIFAGAQDQGMQRGNATDDLVADFTQMISGDYGHITFTGEFQESMWIMYPDGSLSFYDSPLTQKFPTAGYKMTKENSGVWIPQITADPHSKEQSVYLAGGSNSGNGSFIIKVEFDGSDLVASQLPFNFGTSGGTLSAIAISPLQKNVWFAATTNGRVYKSIDQGKTFKLMQSMTSEAQYLYGSCILPSALDTNIVYLSGNGYTNSPVYKSTNGGKSFVSIKQGMPSTVAFNIVANEDESKLFAATEAGPYVFIASQNKWYPLVGVNTPNQTYWSVEYIPSIKTARFGTYGRGVWDFKESPLETKAVDLNEATVKIGPNPTSDYLYVESRADLSKITVHNNQGKQLKINVVKNERIDISDLAAGIYYVKIQAGKKEITKKIVKI
jgi:hypothetical protein